MVVVQPEIQVALYKRRFQRNTNAVALLLDLDTGQRTLVQRPVRRERYYVYPVYCNPAAFQVVQIGTLFVLRESARVGLLSRLCALPRAKTPLPRRSAPQ